MQPVGFQTKTVYDQNHIVKILIPALELIEIHFQFGRVYVSDPTNPC